MYRCLPLVFDEGGVCDVLPMIGHSPRAHTHTLTHSHTHTHSLTGFVSLVSIPQFEEETDPEEEKHRDPTAVKREDDFKNELTERQKEFIRYVDDTFFFSCCCIVIS